MHESRGSDVGEGLIGGQGDEEEEEEALLGRLIQQIPPTMRAPLKSWQEVQNVLDEGLLEKLHGPQLRDTCK